MKEDIMQAVEQMFEKVLLEIKELIRTLAEDSKELEKKIENIRLTPGPKGEMGLRGYTGIEGKL